MSFVEITTSAEQLLEAWGGVPISYDNAPFTPVPDSSWCRLYIIDGDSFNTAIGGSCIKRTGLVIVQVYTNTDIGSAAARDLADQISAVFSNVRDGSVQYLVANATRVGYTDKIYQLNVSIPFELDEVI